VDEEGSSGASAVQALAAFEPRAAALVLEEEVREALLGSLSAAVGARCRLSSSLSRMHADERMCPHSPG
jgi:hypothetical protein